MNLKHRLHHAAWRLSFVTTKAMWALGFRLRRYPIGNWIRTTSDKIRDRRVQKILERGNQHAR